jgi:hypothetical protein
MEGVSDLKERSKAEVRQATQRLTVKAVSKLHQVKKAAEKNPTVVAVRDATLNQVDAVKQSTLNAAAKMTTLRDTATGTAKTWTQRVEELFVAVPTYAIGRANDIIDDYLPEVVNGDMDGEVEDSMASSSSDDEEPLPTKATTDLNNVIATNKTFGTETAALLARAREFSSKVQVRAYAHGLKKMKKLKLRASEVVDKMAPNVVNLLDYANKELDYLCDGDDEAPTAKVTERTASQPTTSHLADYLPSPARRLMAPIARLARLVVFTVLTIAFPADQRDPVPKVGNPVVFSPKTATVYKTTLVTATHSPNEGDAVLLESLSFDLYQQASSDDFVPVEPNEVDARLALDGEEDVDGDGDFGVDDEEDGVYSDESDDSDACSVDGSSANVVEEAE